MHEIILIILSIVIILLIIFTLVLLVKTPSYASVNPDGTMYRSGMSLMPKSGTYVPRGTYGTTEKPSGQKLWSDHVGKTSLYIADALRDDPATVEVASDLLRNQDKIGAYYSSMFGPNTGDNLAILLRDHITIATRLVDDVKTGNSSKLTTDSTEWVINGDLIATELSKFHSIPVFYLKQMFQGHLDITSKELMDLANKKYDEYAKDVTAALYGGVEMGGMLEASLKDVKSVAGMKSS
jgi:hypothetical protein